MASIKNKEAIPFNLHPEKLTAKRSDIFFFPLPIKLFSPVRTNTPYDVV